MRRHKHFGNSLSTVNFDIYDSLFLFLLQFISPTMGARRVEVAKKKEDRKMGNVYQTKWNVTDSEVVYSHAKIFILLLTFYKRIVNHNFNDKGYK